MMWQAKILFTISFNQIYLEFLPSLFQIKRKICVELRRIDFNSPKFVFYKFVSLHTQKLNGWTSLDISGIILHLWFYQVQSSVFALCAHCNLYYSSQVSSLRCSCSSGEFCSRRFVDAAKFSVHRVKQISAFFQCCSVTP